MTIYEEILREFQKADVKYVLVGGIAVNLLGFLRSTADMDILVDMTDGNLTKVVNILKERGYHVKQPVDPIGIADKKTREDWIKNKHMKAFNFYKQNGYGLREIDIILRSPVSFKDAIKSAERVKSGNVTIHVASIDDLIKMKKDVGRPIDKVDIEELRRIKKVRRKNAV